MVGFGYEGYMSLRKLQNRLVREAILRTAVGGDMEGANPADLMLEVGRRYWELSRSENESVALNALNEIANRIDGKAGQEVMAPSDEGRVIDGVLVDRALELLREIRALARPKERVVEPE